MKKNIWGFILVITLILSFTACSDAGKKPENSNGAYSIYYINSAVTRLVSEPLNDVEPGVEELLDILSATSSIEATISPLEGIPVLSYTQVDTRLNLDLGREYSMLSGIREILTRAAIVKTLTQVEGIDTLEILVGSNPLTDTFGNPVGAMGTRDFVEYFGKEQDALTSENFTLYFATDDGASLIDETHRVYYENTMSKEQAVIKTLQEAPETNGAKPAISPGINVINITTTDGVCYLDMDMSFYDPEGNIPYNVAVYAIVNSLCELDDINTVVINIIDTQESVLTDLVDSISGTYTPNSELIN